MSENHLTRREVLTGLAGLPFLAGALDAQAAASSVCFMSPVEMARLIRTKKLSAREALAAHLKQIERVNPKVNAIVTLVPELAAAAAAKADEMQARGEMLGPLHGLPVAHKDLLDTRGIRTTFGSPLYKDNVATEDDIVVDRMRRAGAITIGKTNTPEFGSGSQTFNTVFGATHNPYDLTKTCGGSSGGAAVALACGLVRVAWYKDLGGVPFDPRVRAVVDAHRKIFESLGCIVDQAEPDFAPAEVAFRVLRAWNTANSYGERFREHPEAFKDTLTGEIEEGLRLTGTDVARAEAAHGQIWRRFQAFLETYEYFVLPTTQLPPFDVNMPYPTEVAGVKFDSYIDWMKSCWYISATGNPAASVPAGFTPEGLPVGVQIVGRAEEDFSVLQLAHAFEQVTGFGKRHPAIA